MKANSTKMLPPIVRTIHKLRLIAIKIVCQRLNGARTGTKVGSELVKFRQSPKELLLLFLKNSNVNSQYKRQNIRENIPKNN